jgi:hypothetical protein
MQAREIVRRCIEFDHPPRIGLHFRTAPIEGRIWDESDFAAVAIACDPRFQRQPGQREWTNEWGVGRRSLDNGLGEAVHFPLAEGWHKLDSYRFPDFAADWRYDGLADRIAERHADGKYVYAPVPTLMLLPASLRGMENWFLDHALHPGPLAELLDRIVAARETLIDRYAEAGVDGVITYDDMGTNERPLVSPIMFRDLYVPRYRATCDRLHAHGMHFIHHCCGQVRPYVEMFIEAGCDVLQLDQPTLMGIDWLGEHFGGRLCFWNCVDIQTTIGSGDLDAIDAEAARQVARLAGPRGGFMVKAYQQPEEIGMTAAQAERQYRAFKRLASGIEVQ